MWGSRRGDGQSSRVWTALGWMEEEASFWPANLGASAIVAGVVGFGVDGGREVG